MRKNQMFDSLINPTLLDSMLLDWQIYQAKNSVWKKEMLWKKWLRS